MKTTTRPFRAAPARTFKLLLLSASVHCAFQTVAAQAAEADAPGNASATPVPATAPAALSDVVIRNKKKNPDAVEVQKAPQSITAISGAKLEEQGVTDLREIGNLAPGLSQSRSPVTNLNSSIFIRGIGEPDAQGEPSVGVYIDGLYQPKNLGLNQEFLDIENVDIYRGPQGQEFGHSSNAGAVRITTATPGPEKTLHAKIAYGNFNDARIGLAAGGPLADNIFGSIAISGHARDGFTENVTVHRETNNAANLAARGKLRFTPTSDLDIVLSASGTRDHSTARGYANLANGDDAAHNEYFPRQQFTNYAYSATVNYIVDAHTRINSITGLNGYTENSLFDNTGDSYGRGTQFASYRDHTWSEELRLLGDYDRFSYISGIYAYRENWWTNRRANTAANATTNPAAISYHPAYTIVDQDTNVFAVYGEGKYKVTPALTATAGLRFNDEEHAQSNQLYDLGIANVTTDPTVLFGPRPATPTWDVNAHSRWQSWSPKASLDYAWTTHFLQYVTFSTGTKSGGYDYRDQTISPTGGRQASIPYSPETARNYETGVKADWLGGALRTNVSLFYTRFSDIQVTANDPLVSGLAHRFNAGKGSNRGVEFELTAKPVDNLQLDLSGDLLRATIDRFNGTTNVTNVPASSVNPNGLTLYSAPRNGNALPYAPRFQGRAAASWREALGNGNALLFNGSVDYQTKSYTDPSNNPTQQMPKQTYVNGGITFYPAVGHWSASLTSQNLFNKHYALTRGFTPAAPVASSGGAAIYRSTSYSDPRTILLTLRYDL